MLAASLLLHSNHSALPTKNVIRCKAASGGLSWLKNACISHVNLNFLFADAKALIIRKQGKTVKKAGKEANLVSHVPTCGKVSEIPPEKFIRLCYRIESRPNDE